MLTISRRHAANPPRLDQATRTLLRLVAVRPDWDSERAAFALRAQLDDRILLLLRARVSHAMLDRPTPTDARALAALDGALASSREPAVPATVPCHA